MELNLPVDGRLVDDEFGAWFSGFFDGEGSITCLALSGPRGRKVVFRISLSQRERAVLELVKSRLGGRLYQSKPGLCQWVIDGPARIVTTILPVFDRHPLRTKKGQEWALVRPLLLERRAYVKPGALHTTRTMSSDYFERAAEVHRVLSAGRETWAHLHRPQIMTVPSRRERSARPATSGS